MANLDIVGPDIVGPDLVGPDIVGPDIVGPDIVRCADFKIGKITLEFIFFYLVKKSTGCRY